MEIENDFEPRVDIDEVCPIIEVEDENGLQWYTRQRFPTEYLPPVLDEGSHVYTKTTTVPIHNLFQVPALPFPEFVVDKIFETFPDVKFRQSRSKTHYTRAELGSESDRWSDQRIKFERHISSIRNHQCADRVSLSSHQSQSIHGDEYAGERVELESKRSRQSQGDVVQPSNE